MVTIGEFARMSGTDTGLVRASNQDAAYAGPGLLAVADGFGDGSGLASAAASAASAAAEAHPAPAGAGQLA